MIKRIGVDIGYGYTKCVTESAGMIVPLGFPSIVGIYEAGISVDGLKETEKDVVTIEGQRLLIGQSARKYASRLLDGRHEGWIDSIAYKALLLHALKIADCNSVSLVIVTGLPCNFYQAGKDRLVNLIRDIASGYCVDFTVRILPQPCGTLFNTLLDEKGQVRDGSIASGKVGVLDIGYYTTDLITISDMELVQQQIDSFENGVSTALKLIAKDIEGVYGLRQDLHRTEEAVRQGYVKVFGVQKDIRHITEQRLIQLAREIEEQAKTIWKSAHDIDKVILTGGGASLLKGHLDLYQHAVVTENSQFANGLGFYKYAVRAKGIAQ